MSCYRCDQTASYVEASKCAGNTSDLRVFVHDSKLPVSTSQFEFDTQGEDPNCWTINPAGTKVCLPRDDGVYSHPGPFPYTSCLDCTENADGEEADGTPGNSGGGGGGGLVYPYRKATVCSHHEARALARGWDLDAIYVDAYLTDGPAVTTDIDGVCVTTVDEGSLIYQTYEFGNRSSGIIYPNCTDCGKGVQASLCPDYAALPEAGDAPDVWIRSGDLTGAPDSFARNGWCYTKNTTPVATIPADAVIFKPTVGVPCATCGLGVAYTLCPGERSPGVTFWATLQDINEARTKFPDATVIYSRVGGRCHSLDLDAAVSRIPTNAPTHAPRCAYASCAQCKCGGGLDEACDEALLGVPVRVCVGQSTSGWVETWMPEDRLPFVRTSFSHQGLCVFVNPDNTPSKIPIEAAILNTIDNTYPSCGACLGGNGNDTDDDLPPIPPDPPDGGAGEPRWFIASPCGGGTRKWVLLPRFTNIRAGKYDGDCYRVKHPGRLSKPGGEDEISLTDTRTGYAGSGCDLFRPGECDPLYHLEDCEGGLPPRTIAADLSALLGDIVRKIGRCWTVKAGAGGGPNAELGSYEGPYETCVGCLPHCKVIWESYWYCDTESWSTPGVVGGVTCDFCDETDWTYDRCESGAVVYRRVVCGAACAATVECSTEVTPPAGPTIGEPPEAAECCPPPCENSIKRGQCCFSDTTKANYTLWDITNPSWPAGTNQAAFVAGLAGMTSGVLDEIVPDGSGIQFQRVGPDYSHNGSTYRIIVSSYYHGANDTWNMIASLYLKTGGSYTLRDQMVSGTGDPGAGCCGDDEITDSIDSGLTVTGDASVSVIDNGCCDDDGTCLQGFADCDTGDCTGAGGMP